MGRQQICHLQTCQVVRISHILYENSFKIREYDFHLNNTDFEHLEKYLNRIAIYSIKRLQVEIKESSEAREFIF